MMGEMFHNKFEGTQQKNLLNNEDFDILQIESEVSRSVEFLISKVEEKSSKLENGIPEINKLEAKDQNYEVEEFCDTKKKSVGHTNEDISKLESGVPSGDMSSRVRFRIDSSDLEKEIDFSFTKKKKKKKSAVIHENKILAEDECNVLSNLLNDMDIYDSFLNDTNSDYSYDYLLSRCFDLMREKNSNTDITVRKKLIMKPPQVLRVGTKRTSFANFLELCKIMRRTPQHVQSFLVVELGTNGSVDSNGQLLIKGKFMQKQLENVLRRYIREYVTCHTCHSPDTMLLKETRLCFLQCEACGSRCSVPVIKSGFQAVINKRAAMRAKCN